jgi:hypothetical protein
MPTPSPEWSDLFYAGWPLWRVALLWGSVGVVMCAILVIEAENDARKQNEASKNEKP